MSNGTMNQSPNTEESISTTITSVVPSDNDDCIPTGSSAFVTLDDDERTK